MPAVGRLWPSDDDDEDADDGGALLSYVSDGRVFLSQDQQHTQMSCPLSCSNHSATWHDDDDVVDVFDVGGDVFNVDDGDVIEFATHTNVLPSVLLKPSSHLAR